MKCISITVTGRVQGVGFRYHTLRLAESIGVKGFVSNKGDGTVYIEAEADEQVLQEFVNWCRNGPRWAIIDAIDISDIDLQDYPDFSIK
jgi:acylphosphatase